MDGESQLPFLDLYQAVTNEYFNRMRLFGIGRPVAPLVMLVTQRCRLEAMRARLNEQKQQLLGPVAVIRKRLTRQLHDVMAQQWYRYAEPF